MKRFILALVNTLLSAFLVLTLLFFAALGSAFDFTYWHLDYFENIFQAALIIVLLLLTTVSAVVAWMIAFRPKYWESLTFKLFALASIAILGFFLTLNLGEIFEEILPLFGIDYSSGSTPIGGLIIYISILIATIVYFVKKRNRES